VITEDVYVAYFQDLKRNNGKQIRLPVEEIQSRINRCMKLIED